MYIIIENECLDTSMFTKMKLYDKSGIIAFIYKNEIDGTEAELPVTFDDAFQAELFFDEIIEKIDNHITCQSSVHASVPVGLLAKMKRGMYIQTQSKRDYDFDSITDENNN